MVSLVTPEALSQLGTLKRFVSQASDDGGGRYISRSTPPSWPLPD
ncbi:hypothetical protein [Streptomyces niveus]